VAYRGDVSRVDPEPARGARTRNKAPLVDDRAGLDRVGVVEEELCASAACSSSSVTARPYRVIQTVDPSPWAEPDVAQTMPCEANR
jgi:hypothetical protein